VKALTDIYDKLLYVCKHVTNNHELSEDLRQEAILELLELGEEKLKELENNGSLERYAVGRVYILWYFGSKEKTKKNVNNFTYKYRSFAELASISVDDVRHLADDFLEVWTDGAHERQLQAQKDLKEVYGFLDSFEAFVLNEYGSRGCKVSQFAKDVDLSRQQLTKRIEFIKDKIRNEYSS